MFAFWFAPFYTEKCADLDGKILTTVNIDFNEIRKFGSSQYF